VYKRNYRRISPSSDFPARSLPPLVIIPHRILIPRPALQIPLKRERHIEHLFNMHHAQRLALIDRERLRRAHRVLDLPAVEVVLRKAVVVLLAEGQRRRALEDAHLLEEHLEDGFLGFGGELAVAEGDVDAGLEGVVEGLERELVGDIHF
jgi:hypothetical protein